MLDSVDSILARNDGSLPVCATRLSVASAAAFSKVCGSFDGVQAAISAAAPERDQGGGETAGERRDDGVHLHSLLKKSVSSAVMRSSDAFCRISVQRAWRSAGVAGGAR